MAFICTFFVSLFFFTFYFTWMGSFACVCLCTTCNACGGQKKAPDPPGDGSEPLCRCWKSNPGPLEEPLNHWGISPAPILTWLKTVFLLNATSTLTVNHTSQVDINIKKLTIKIKKYLGQLSSVQDMKMRSLFGCLRSPCFLGVEVFSTQIAHCAQSGRNQLTCT